MKKRIKLGEHDGWREKSINYKHEDSDMNFSCGERDWKRYEIVYKLVEEGVDENILEELWDLGYEEGRDDEVMSNMGEEL